MGLASVKVEVCVPGRDRSWAGFSMVYLFVVWWVGLRKRDRSILQNQANIIGSQIFK